MAHVIDNANRAIVHTLESHLFPKLLLNLLPHSLLSLPLIMPTTHIPLLPHTRLPLRNTPTSGTSAFDGIDSLRVLLHQGIVVLG